MINKLRKKFLLITFISLFLVVAVIVGYINLFNSTNTMNKHHTLIERLIENDGFVENNGNSFEQIVSRYIVIIDISNNDITILQGTIEIDVVDDVIESIISNEKTYGKYLTYAYGIKDTDDGHLIVLSNFERDSQLITTYFYNSIIISLLGILCVYIILYFSSSLILKPFIRNEENQKEFITNASHELKTPITIIKANLDVLKIDDIDNEWTKSIEEQTNRLELLTSNLINLSKVEENDILIKTEFSLSDAIIEEASTYKSILKDKSINLDIKLIDNITFNGSEKHIRDVIKLILDNIVKYTTSNANIYVENNILYFTNSTELSNGNYDFIFNRFSRISSSRNQDINGYGIGLSIVKKILNNHNLDINAYVLNNTFYLKIKL